MSYPFPKMPLYNVFHLPLILIILIFSSFSLSWSMTSLKSRFYNVLRFRIPFLDATRINLCHLFKVLDSIMFLTLTNKSCASLFHLPAASKALSFYYFSFKVYTMFLILILSIPFFCAALINLLQLLMGIE